MNAIVSRTEHVTHQILYFLDLLIFLTRRFFCICLYKTHSFNCTIELIRKVREAILFDIRNMSNTLPFFLKAQKKLTCSYILNKMTKNA